MSRASRISRIILPRALAAMTIAHISTRSFSPISKSVNDDTSEFSEGEFICADYARKDQGAANEAVGYAYRHLYIAPRTATGAQPRSKYQTLVRCLTRSKVVDSSPYVTSIVM